MDIDEVYGIDYFLFPLIIMPSAFWIRQADKGRGYRLGNENMREKEEESEKKKEADIIK